MKEIKELLAVTKKLRDKYPTKNFTLDGKLVGDIGEVLCAEKYGLKLYSENAVVHDGEEKSSGRKVQIKASFRNYSYFPYGEAKLPEYFLSVNILENGDIEELYNGPGHFVRDNYILARNLKAYNKTYYTLSKGVLLDLNKRVSKRDKIKEVR